MTKNTSLLVTNAQCSFNDPTCNPCYAVIDDVRDTSKQERERERD